MNEYAIIKHKYLKPHYSVAVAQDESSKPLKQSRDNDDNSSEYFADAETSSCGSFDLDDEYDFDSDDKPTDKGL